MFQLYSAGVLVTQSVQVDLTRSLQAVNQGHFWHLLGTLCIS